VDNFTRHHHRVVKRVACSWRLQFSRSPGVIVGVIGMVGRPIATAMTHGTIKRCNQLASFVQEAVEFNAIPPSLVVGATTLNQPGALSSAQPHVQPGVWCRRLADVGGRT
jgi:hypothetical protein